MEPVERIVFQCCCRVLTETTQQNVTGKYSEENTVAEVQATASGGGGAADLLASVSHAAQSLFEVYFDPLPVQRAARLFTSSPAPSKPRPRTTIDALNRTSIGR